MRIVSFVFILGKFADKRRIRDGEFFVRDEEAGECNGEETSPWHESIEQDIDPRKPSDILRRSGGLDGRTHDVSALIGAILDFDPRRNLVVV